SSCPGIEGVRSRPERSVHVPGQVSSPGVNPDACTSTTAALPAGSGSGRSVRVIPAGPAVLSVTTTALTVGLLCCVPRSPFVGSPPLAAGGPAALPAGKTTATGDTRQ